MFDALVWSLVNWIVLSTICSSFPAFLNYLDDFSMMVWVKLQQIWWKEKIPRPFSPIETSWSELMSYLFGFPKKGFHLMRSRSSLHNAKWSVIPRPKVTAFLLMVLNIVVTQFRLWQMSQFLWFLWFFIKFFSIIKQPFCICIKNKNKQWGMEDNVTKMSVARLLIHIERLAV